MGYLGLDGTEVKDDNMFVRMFWPSDHAGETDTLGQQGFWVCFAVAILSFGLLLLQGHWFLAIFTLAFYWLGGMGVREHSQPAAVLVAVVYLLNTVASLFAGIPPGVLPLAVFLLLAANIRGTFIAAKWAATGDPDAMPERMNSTFGDKLVDQMPRRVWPAAKIPFFILAGIYTLLTLLGMVMMATGLSKRIVDAQHPQPASETIEIPASR